MVREKLAEFARKIDTIPKKYLWVSMCVLGILSYLFFFVLPRPVEFSYSGQTCRTQLTLLPGIHETVDSSRFLVRFEHVWKIGSVELSAGRVCFEPTNPPSDGTAVVATAPYGWWIFRAHYTLIVGDAPKILSSATPVSLAVTKPLLLVIDQPDTTFEYNIVAGNKQQLCSAKTAQLECDIDALGLTQGATHTVEITRSFHGSKQTKVASASIAVLPAVTVIDSSVKDTSTIYAKPRSFTFTVDKNLKSAATSLALIEAETNTPVAAKTTTKDSLVTVTFDEDLQRDKNYRLTLTKAEAKDGSTITDQYVINFKVSSGPKVTGVSVGSSGVAQSAQIVVSFDQTLSPSQDISKIATFSGGAMAVTKKGNQIVYSLQNFPKCTDFSLSLAKGLLSEYDIASTESWSHASRTTCYSTSTIGYSVKGRPITAYWFGNGSSTVLFTGAIHGNEQSSSLILKDLVGYLEANAQKLPANRQVVIVPTLSPDGLASRTRNNAHNVNLNRNFPTADWKADINDTNGPVIGGGGSAPLSEPEAKAIATLSQQLRPRFVMSFHAVGSMAIANEAGDSPTQAARYASLLGYRNGTGQTNFDYDLSGNYDDWLATKQGIPSIVVELGSYTYRNFSAHRPAMWNIITL